PAGAGAPQAPTNARLAAAGERATEQGAGKARRMHLCRGVERAEGARDHRLAVDPAWSRNAMAARHRAVLARRDHESVHAAVAVVGGDLLGEPRVEREARAGDGAPRHLV